MFVYLGSDINLEAILIIGMHDEKGHHECTKQPSNVGQGIIVLSKASHHRKGKT